MGKTDKAGIAKDYLEKGFLLQKSGHLDRAAHFYKRSIEFKPTAQAHTFLGWIYSLKGRYEEAIQQCKSAIALNPDYGNPYNDIGAYLLQMNRYDESIPWFEKALNAPDYENYSYPYLNLGRVYEFKGDCDKALKLFKKAIEQDTAYEPAQIAYQSLLAKYN